METLKELVRCPLRVQGTWFEIKHPTKGWTHIMDMRGWGFLTGKGHGALGLPEGEAITIQRDLAAEVVHTWNSYHSLVKRNIELEAEVEALKAGANLSPFSESGR